MQLEVNPTHSPKASGEQFPGSSGLAEVYELLDELDGVFLREIASTLSPHRTRTLRMLSAAIEGLRGSVDRLSGKRASRIFITESRRGPGPFPERPR